MSMEMAFWTEHSVRIIVDGCISGVSARRGSFVLCSQIIWQFGGRPLQPPNLILPVFHTCIKYIVHTYMYDDPLPTAKFKSVNMFAMAIWDKTSRFIIPVNISGYYCQLLCYSMYMYLSYVYHDYAMVMMLL